ncbi:MAG TPA: PQQ-binding-like beta-propeller repeat protein, partial [Ktedonobacterales bacterium]|nr:PQQ-binding-like beta-propeller repeat protein [Ktedonobacterales bacterium]
MASAHRRDVRRRCQPSLLIGVLLSTLLLSACAAGTAGTAGTAATGGTLRWRFQTGGSSGVLPRVANGLVYFGGAQDGDYPSSVYALDA